MADNTEFFTCMCTPEILRWIKFVLLYLTGKKTEMSAKGGSITGSVTNGENIVQTSTELSKIEMTDTADNEALQKESVNVVESETNGEVNPPENQGLEGEEVDDQVRTSCVELDLRQQQ